MTLIVESLLITFVVSFFLGLFAQYEVINIFILFLYFCLDYINFVLFVFVFEKKLFFNKG